MTLSDWLKAVQQVLIDEYGLNSGFAEKISYLYYWSQMYGISFDITSGWRDPKRQAALRARWDRGDRAGLIARPATTSKHCNTRLGRPSSLAVDVSSSDLSTLGEWAVKYLDLRWGGNFRRPDPVHFDVK